MYKIDWDKYLSIKRYRESEFDKNRKANPVEMRNAFDSDFGRVAFSSAIRRMHDKAQVIPLTSGDNVHTRLTHSLEVMSIANSLGIDLCRNKDFSDTYGEKAMNLERCIPIILKTAALVHDIGNPPFGHFGETVIQEYFKEYLKVRHITDSQALDFTRFDGNAEGFRILTRLQYIGDLAGLNLTYTTLAAYTKYPNVRDVNKGYIGTKKHGVFSSEEDILQNMVNECHLALDDKRIKRHPLSFLVEAADSICYLVMDIEDGFTMNWYGFNDIVKFIDNELNGKILDVLRIDFSKKGINENDERRKMTDFRVKLIQYLVDIAIKNFTTHLEEIDKGTYSKELIEDGNTIAKILGNFAKANIYPRREIEQIELTGFSVLNGLLDILTMCAFSDEKKFRNHIKSVLSGTHLKVAKHSTDKMLKPTKYKYYSDEELKSFDIEELNTYERLRLIVDLISGMTDKYAVSLYQKLSGQKLS